MMLPLVLTLPGLSVAFAPDGQFVGHGSPRTKPRSALPPEVSRGSKIQSSMLSSLLSFGGTEEVIKGMPEGTISMPSAEPSMTAVLESVFKRQNILDTKKGSGSTGGIRSRSADVLASGLSLKESIPSGQNQLPLQKRVVKAMYEEIVPWAITLSVPAIFSVLSQSTVPLELSTVAELAFVGLCMNNLMQFNQPTSPQPLLATRDWSRVRDLVWTSLPDVQSKRSFLMGWFYDMPFERLRAEDAMTYLAWMRFGITEECLTTQQLIELEEDMLRLQREVNNGEELPRRKEAASAEEEAEAPLPCIRFNLEPVRFRHKPLIFYVLTHGLYVWLTSALSSNFGFVYVPPSDPKESLGYWYRAPKEKVQGSDNKCSATLTTPLVFVHGVGGLGFYYQLLAELEGETDGAIVLLDLPFVSLRVASDIPSINNQIESICNILDETVGRDTKATFVGHSFGSIVLSWMVQSRPERVASCVFMDPVCFQVHLADTLFNFHMKRVDQSHQNGNAWENPLSVGGLTSLAGTEIHTNHAMLRHFWWASSALWPQDLEEKKIPSYIILSEEDEIVPTADVDQLIENFNSERRRRRYSPFNFAAPVMRRHVLGGAKHGEVFFNEQHRKKAVRVVAAMLRMSDVRNTSRWNVLSPSSLPGLIQTQLW